MTRQTAIALILLESLLAAMVDARTLAHVAQASASLGHSVAIPAFPKETQTP